MSAGVSLPGFDSPAVGFDQPFEMLLACHDRVQRSLALLTKLIAHVEQHGHDEQSRSAAADVLRYFELAAPRHHEDEERHVFPPLLAHGSLVLRTAVRALQDDHQRMDALWTGLRPVLTGWSGPGAQGRVDARLREDATRFRALYLKHIETEEGLVYPAARKFMPADALHTMSQDMQARRQH